MRPLILYHTSHCHLCKLAAELIKPLLIQYDFQLFEQDIKGSESLMACYALKIPVLFRPDNDTELNWPFAEQQLHKFLA